jgi:hypothetical protein
VAIKTLVFEDGAGEAQTALIASEAAIASNLVHRNVVATYSHDICNVCSETEHEPGIFKFYLIQVWQCCTWRILSLSCV